jgi:hypothetical protein
MHDGYKSWLMLCACLAVGCGEGAVDLGGSDASGWFDTPSQGADRTRPQTLFEAETRVYGLAVDETTLYALLDHGAQGSELVSCPIDRCRSERSTLSFFPRDGFATQTPLVLVGDQLYWIVSSGWPGQGVASCSLGGCQTPDLALSSVQSNIAGDGEHVYWIDSDGRLNRRGPGSAELTMVRDLGRWSIPMLTVAGNHVYFVDNNVDTVGASTIYRVRKDGSEVDTPFATDQNIGGIGVTTEALYYTTSTLAGAILSCSLAGCEDLRKAIATNQRWPSGIQVNHSEAFWINTVRPSTDLVRFSLSSCPLPECSMKEIASEFLLPDWEETLSSRGSRVAINRTYVLWAEAIYGSPGSAIRRLAR